VTRAQRHAVRVLGAVQCLLWGLLYYGFSALLAPVQQDLGLDRVVLAGAFSFGLLGMALGAPAAGRLLDAGRGAALFRGGLALAIAGLAWLASTHHVAELYLAWGLIGLAMAAVLYEPAFGLVARSIVDSGDRLRALSTITVMGGLASTLCLPVFSYAIERGGWRGAVWLTLPMLLLAGAALERWTLPALSPRTVSTRMSEAPLPQASRAAFEALRVISLAGTLAAVGLSVLLIPLLLERGVAPVPAASVLGMFGLSQLPGRVWLMRARRTPDPGRLLALPLLLQAAGLGAIVLHPALATTLLGVFVFGLGSGLLTLARPWLVQQLFGGAQAGLLNGRLARSQGFARAAAPVAAALLASRLSLPWALAALGVLQLLVLPVARWLARHPAAVAAEAVAETG
jgi:hypothetical protein